MTVSDEIIKVLDALCEKFGIAIDWTATNVLPYITTLFAKLVSYEIWTSVGLIGIMAVLSVIGVIYIIKRPFKECYQDDDFIGGMINIVAHVFIFIAFIVIGCEIFDIIKCATFPELYVFEYIKGLASSGG